MNPVRAVTSALRVSNQCDNMVSVKTSVPVKKQDVFRIMAVLKNTAIAASIKAGDALISDVCGADIVATKTVD